MVKKLVVVVDDDLGILKRARSILSEDGKDVVVLKSGEMLFDYISKKGFPDIILLDIRMPETDGYQVLKELRKLEPEGQETPVIFLTGNDDDETEIKGLSLGAMDFIRKPFVAEILLLRVNHALELDGLHKDLAREVEIKTRENERLSFQVVSALTDAIDAKDTYTNGHSKRVAMYSLEIAKRMGFSMEKQDEIYMMGLLHDVGKIGVPDSVINKNKRLDDDEFALIQKHPEIGGSILGNIEEMPRLAYGAKWHHERYDGTGYPDGLKGDEIPIEARIITVADAYDAMMSNRSYRKMLPVEKVKSEIMQGKGTQFDPQIADIMLELIDEGIFNNL